MDSYDAESLYTEKSLKDYKVYELSAKETSEYFLCACAICFAMGMLFYNNIFIAGCICVLSIFFKDRYAKYKCDKRRQNMLEAFKDALYCISASVTAGRQLPYAIEDAANQSELFEDVLADEFRYMVNVYKQTHGSIEDMLMDLADRSGIEEIKLFAMSCRICKKSGGDLERVCLRSAFLLIERIDYQNEVSAILSEKKLDSLILMAMPPLILFFLNLTAYDYVAILYEGLEGRIIMSFCLLLIALAGLWSLRLMTLDL